MEPENTETESTESSAPTGEAIEELLTEFGGVFGEDARPDAQKESAEAKAVETAPAVSTEVAEGKEAAAEAEKELLLSPLLAARKQAEQEQRAKVEQLEAGAAASIAAAKKEFIDSLRRNPQQFIAEHGLQDFAGELALHAYAADLGDEASAELKAEIGVSDFDRYKAETDKRFAAMEAATVQRETQARNTATLDQYRGLIAEIPESMPYLASEANADAEEVLRTMAGVADHLHSQSGKYPSAMEVATMIERQISETAERYSLIKQPNVKSTQTTTVPVETKPSPTETLSVANQGKAARKAPVGEDEYFEDALEMLKALTAPKP